jgi:tRNA(Ile)-lysidine synthase
MPDINNVLLDAVQPWAAKHTSIVVAYSGGRDSAVLLDCLVKTTMYNPHVNIHVVHVNHGLQDIAMDWEIHAFETVEKYKKQKDNVYFHLHRANIQSQLETSVSIENIARKARYEALETIAREHNSDAIFLGHHLQDQAETFLLQATRGAGIMGLASMPFQVEKNGVKRIRPFLHIDRAHIEEYASKHGISYVDDPTNEHDVYLRNAIRLNVMPTLREHAPGIDKGLALAASHCAEALEALTCIAQEDLERVKTNNNSLDTNMLSEWPTWRTKNVIRHWIQKELKYPSNAAGTERIMEMLQSKKEGLIPLNKYQTISLHSNTLSFRSNAPTIEASIPDTRIEIRTPMFEYENATWKWNGPLPYVLIAGPRREGLYFSLGEQRPSRPIKKQYQSVGMSVLERKGFFWYSENGDLVFAPGLGFNHQFQYRLELVADAPMAKLNSTLEDVASEPNA